MSSEFVNLRPKAVCNTRHSAIASTSAPCDNIACSTIQRNQKTLGMYAEGAYRRSL